MKKKSKCYECEKELGEHNKSGYCSKCYPKSKAFREYQRKKQLEYYYKHKARKKAYYQRPDIKLKIKKYLKKYFQDPINKERKRQADKRYRERKSKELNFNKKQEQALKDF